MSYLSLNHRYVKDNNRDIDKMISLVQLSPEYIVYSDKIDMQNEIQNFIDDPEKLIYTKDISIYQDKRNFEDKYPKIINESI